MIETVLLVALVSIALDGWFSARALERSRSAREIGPFAAWAISRGASPAEAMLLYVVFRWAILGAVIPAPETVVVWVAGLSTESALVGVIAALAILRRAR